MPFLELAGAHLGMADWRVPAACVCDGRVTDVGFSSFDVRSLHDVREAGVDVAVLVRSFV